MTTFADGIGRNLALNTQGTLIDNLDGTQHQPTGYRPEFTYLDIGALFTSDEEVTVTVSFDLVMTVNTANPQLQVYNGNFFGPMQIVTGRNALQGETHAVGETIEKRVAVTTRWRPVDTPSKPGNIIEFYSTYGSGNVYSISNLMVELGDVAHPYRPAPEDTEQPSDLVYASDGVDLGDTSGLATDAAARGYASDAQAAATAAANGYADAQVATRARTFATGWTYALTADASVDASKTYYTRTGAGTEADPYTYAEVADPVDSGLPTYYEMVPETPAPPYSQGDMWLQGDGGAILVCVAAKASGEAYAAEDWEPASGYTDDAAADALSAGMAALADADSELAARMDTADAANQAALAEMDARVASAEDAASGVSARLVSLEDYVRVVGGDHLELGKAGSAVTASLENDRLAFLLVGQDAPVAYIAADEDGTGKLFVTQAVVVSELQFGHGKWAWTERKNGNMALKWRGGEA